TGLSPVGCCATCSTTCCVARSVVSSGCAAAAGLAAARPPNSARPVTATTARFLVFCHCSKRSRIIVIATSHPLGEFAPPGTQAARHPFGWVSEKRLHGACRRKSRTARAHRKASHLVASHSLDAACRRGVRTSVRPSGSPARYPRGGLLFNDRRPPVIPPTAYGRSVTDSRGGDQVQPLAPADHSPPGATKRAATRIRHRTHPGTDRDTPSPRQPRENPLPTCPQHRRGAARCHLGPSLHIRLIASGVAEQPTCLY